MKRISLSEYDAGHLYEFAYEWLASEEGRMCGACAPLKKRLEKFIGAKEVARIKRTVKKYPYLTSIVKEMEGKRI